MSDLRPVPLTSVSPSKLKLYCRCARRYYYAYGENLRDGPTAETAFGLYLHEALDRYLRHLVRSRQERDGVRLYAIARDLRDGSLPADGASSYAEADLLLSRFAARAVNPQQVYALEKPFRVPLLPDGSITLTGRVDRIDLLTPPGQPPLLHIIDYKSGRNKLTDDEVAGDLQAQAYVVAAYHLFRRRYREFRFTLLYLRDQTHATCSTSYREDWFAALATLAQRIRDDREFARAPGPHCRFCPAFRPCQPPREEVDRVPAQ